MRRKTKMEKRKTITSSKRSIMRNRMRIDSPSSKSAIQNTRNHLKILNLLPQELRIRRRRSPL